MIGKSTILLVDDDTFVLNVTRKALGGQNYTILTADSGQKGLSVLRENDVHLIIADQKMEGMTGLELLKMAKDENPHIITIVLTAYAEISTAMKAINEVGVFKFIIKPWNAFDLRVTVHRALETRALIMEKKLLSDKIKKNNQLLTKISKQYPDLLKSKVVADLSR